MTRLVAILLVVVMNAATGGAERARVDQRASRDVDTIAGDRSEAPLSLILARAGNYTARLHAQLAGIVAEEIYHQEVRAARASSLNPTVPRRRALKSDLLLVRTAPEGRYVEYRDVFEVDGTPVRDRQERLSTLFLTPSESNRRKLKAIIDESARYNIGEIPRNINTPMLTLSFLLEDMQARFRFRRVRERTPALGETDANRGTSDNVFRVTTAMNVIAFAERRRATVIRADDGRDFPSAGRFWVDPETGAVLMSELRMDNRQVSATINVSYQSEPLLGFLVPAEMRERYEASGVSIEGRATYGRFRQFQVHTRESIRPPGPSS